jgi:hypothetical protein
MSDAEVLTMPRILHEGRYRLYENPDGGIHVAYKPDNTEQVQHFEVPGFMLKMAQAASEGKLSPMDMVKEMMRRRKNDHLCTSGSSHGIISGWPGSPG